jgi:hypothetical protein
MWKCGVAIAAAALGGCASFSYFSDNYAAMEAQTIVTKGEAWRVSDRGTERKLLVQRNVGNTPPQGLAGAGNLTAAASGRPDYQAAAEAFLAQSGRTCTIKDGAAVIPPSWEFIYECSAGAQPQAK